jgi:hypothetical protein
MDAEVAKTFGKSAIQSQPGSKHKNTKKKKRR